MSEIFEGLGTAVEGGLMARVLDPDSGAKDKHPDQPENCANCEAELLGAYCHACGQSAHIHRTIGGFMHDLLHGALHFEGKFWRTLPLLALRPGRLTRRYIEGARARFVSPMALFLFSIFLMFAVFQVLGISTPTDLGGESPPLEMDLPAEVAEGLRANPEVEDGFANFFENGEFANEMNVTGIEWIDQGIGKKWIDNPSLMLYKMQANSYKFSWLLIPISIPFVWLIFAWKRRFKGYDHAIFVTYSLSFMTLLFVVLSAMGAMGVSEGFLTIAGLLIPPIHLYKQLRGAYSLSRFSAFWRLIALSAFIWIIIIIFLQILIVLGGF